MSACIIQGDKAVSKSLVQKRMKTSYILTMEDTIIIIEAILTMTTKIMTSKRVL